MRLLLLLILLPFPAFADRWSEMGERVDQGLQEATLRLEQERQARELRAEMLVRENEAAYRERQLRFEMSVQQMEMQNALDRQKLR